jgi:hypothetical protein
MRRLLLTFSVPLALLAIFALVAVIVDPGSISQATAAALVIAAPLLLVSLMSLGDVILRGRYDSVRRARACMRAHLIGLTTFALSYAICRMAFTPSHHENVFALGVAAGALAAAALVTGYAYRMELALPDVTGDVR